MSSLKVYNSLTRQKEVFTPVTPGYVGMYVCGPTVSGESHLGHARPYITFDIVYRYLRHLGYKVRYVRNITDAGHFEEEGREAEDKISKKAVIEKLEPMELVQKYTNLFHWAMEQFNTIAPSIEPTATGHIVEQIVMIEKIIEDGYAYVANGSVYFDVEKYNEDFSKKGMPYGMLSGRVLDEQIDTTRDLENQDEKRNKSDFALWKNAPPEHIMRWKSPWGYGFPGWHIECSAMSNKYLGDQFDIHGGGMDLQFPHHECEIAQSAVCNHKTMARYWLHNNMITINGRKMGKSYNNVIKLSEMFSGKHPLLQQAYSPMTIRFFILQTHYRSTLDFSNEALQAAEKGLKRLWEAYENLQLLESDDSKKFEIDDDMDRGIKNMCAMSREAINDDFNTAKSLSQLMNLVNTINSFKYGIRSVNEINAGSLAYLKETFKTLIEDIFGLTKPALVDAREKLDEAIKFILEIRDKAKKERNFKLSDFIRQRLENLELSVRDNKNGESEYSLESSVLTKENNYDERFIFFNTNTQVTFLEKSGTTVSCILKNNVSGRYQVKWKEDIDKIKVSKVSFEEDIDNRFGIVDFSKSHKGWLVSKNLFSDKDSFINKLDSFLKK